MNKLLSDDPLFQFVSVGKTERRPFYSNHNELQLALSQRNRSEGIYGYNVSTLNSKNKISVFLLAFFLRHLNSYISIKTTTVNFSRIIPNQITENINIH